MRPASAPFRTLLWAVVLALFIPPAVFEATEPLPQDIGAAGVWQKLRKLQTTASVLHTTAHPDDEHGGLLAMLSRGQGVRTALLTLNRGEAGDNAIGSELFDTLGLIRTEELRVAGAYYGLDAQYFTAVVDYGFSKRLDEALDTWGREAILADMVRAIRTERPFVIVSRFQGNARDGHGQHQAAGLMTQEAFLAAGDPKRFPEQLTEGLRPWQALKLYMGGARSDEPWTIEVDPGAYDPVLGDSYTTFARRGLSFQRSQTSGRFVPQPGSTPAYYVRLVASKPGATAPPTPSTASTAAATTSTTAPAKGTDGAARTNGRAGAARTAGTGGTSSLASAAGRQPGAPIALAPAAPPPAVTPDVAAHEASFFDGIDTTLPGIYRALGLREPPGAAPLLAAIDQQVQQAVAAFSLTNPAASAPALARGITATRNALAKLGTDPDVAQVLRVKERQFIDALTASLGLSITGLALPDATPEPSGPGFAFAAVRTLPPLVPGQTFGVRAAFATRSAAAVTLRALDLVAPSGWTIKGGNPGLASRLLENRPAVQRFEVTVAPDAPLTQSHFYRDSPTTPHYRIVGGVDRNRPWPPPPVLVRAEFEIDGTIVATTEPVQRRESRLPYGYDLVELAIVPPIVLTVTPAQAIVPAAGTRKPIPITVEVTNNQPREAHGTLAISLPQDWRADPATQPFTLGSGEHARFAFSVSTPTVKPATYRLDVSATSNGRSYVEGAELVAHRDLEPRYRYRPARTTVQVLNASISPNLRVGYVMGVGDEIPSAIAQLGATVELLNDAALAGAPLDRFDAIVLGTRAYAVRPDLRAANQRLLDYARNGGNLIVLYNTPELDPATQAPFTGKLPANAEEVSEEDAAVTILAPDHPVFTRPNRITPADFNGWIEQRGSKFWSEWNAAYTPLLESHDRDQAPQRGGWLYARYGKGHYSYVAYAFHRQLPSGVPGAYRLMANLLSLGRS